MKLMPLEMRGISNSRIAFGCMGLGGGWNHNALTKEDYIQAEKAIGAALSIGITMFDHADIYTYGKAEAVFGRILKISPSCASKWFYSRSVGFVLKVMCYRSVLIFLKSIS
jgi:aryl-alcohol dehydrogenase-like predicted oxidoreductase